MSTVVYHISLSHYFVRPSSDDGFYIISPCGIFKVFILIQQNMKSPFYSETFIFNFKLCRNDLLVFFKLKSRFLETLYSQHFCNDSIYIYI